MISPSTTPRISIVIASYNGAKYIREQLDSIFEQTMKPDEVIIADDCSTDGTFELCRKYIDNHNLHGWTVHRNTENLGVNSNFRNALMKATGDYIFTCDQDDIWVDDKISVMVKAMNEHPEILLLVSNYIPFHDDEKINAKVSSINRDDGEIIPMRLKQYWLGNLRPGCTFCFRREILSRFSVMDIPERLHDSMLWKYAVVCDGLYLINRQLILYRRHGSNATNQFNRT
ncbi:MAG: glycosyltransferase family 2 protein, partial [Synergistaceae bacterium]|nr:glycosyltransferase family 2 protein [Synergistaceae bacterium]